MLVVKSTAWVHLGFVFMSPRAFETGASRHISKGPRTVLEVPDSSPYKLKKNDRNRETA
jgi:hypothetical protein